MVRDGDVREFLKELSDKRLHQHLKMYARTDGMADRAAMAQAEIDARLLEGDTSRFLTNDD